MKTRKRRIVARVIQLKKSNDDYDIKFWQEAGAFMRFSAAWQMIGEFYKMKGKHGYKLRLQRSVQSIQEE